MLITTAFIASAIVALLGMIILWSNPGRRVSWTVSFCSFQIAAWLGFLHAAIVSPPGEGLYWVRWACAIGGLIPFSFWAVKESLLTNFEAFGLNWIVKQWKWVLATSLLVAVPFTNYFIPAHSTDAQRLYGFGYYGYMWTLLALYAIMFIEAFRRGRILEGARRLELQIWLGGGCAMVASVIITMALNAITGNRVFIRTQPLLVLFFFGGLAYAITARRIFDARQLLLVGLEKFILVASVALAAFCLDRVFVFFLPDSFAFFATTAVALWIAVTMNGWLDRTFRFYPQATMARHAAFTAAQREGRLEKLEAAFCSIVKGWGQTENAVILSGGKDQLVSNGITLESNGPVLNALRQLRWVTPERISRERPTSDRRALNEFLKELDLGLAVIEEGPGLTILIGVGTSVSRRPYTYPQVTQLTELASIMESALERAHFSAKVQHTEQLATVGLLGASLAHEIRNPLVTIKTFVQLLPKHHQDPAFREKFFKLIGDEVGRIDQLTEQLLDLASPRSYVAEMIELHPVLRASIDLVAAKASDKKIQFITELQAQPDVVFTDASAAKQVMLNLCFNAIQAVEAHKDAAERWVRVVTRNVASGIEMMVADSGPGIATEIRPRLFQPFQTTKSSGFGLGLAICSDILTNLNATITVDPSEPARGATFRVIFPCQPLSS